MVVNGVRTTSSTGDIWKTSFDSLTNIKGEQREQLDDDNFDYSSYFQSAGQHQQHQCQQQFCSTNSDTTFPGSDLSITTERIQQQQQLGEQHGREVYNNTTACGAVIYNDCSRETFF